MKKQLLSVIALGLLGGLFLTGNSWGQDGVRPPKAGATTAPVFRPDPNTPTNRSEIVPFIGRGGNVFFADSASAPRMRIEHLMIELSEADDDAKKADLKKQLELAVTENFEEDLTTRETDLKKLEERLTKLRAQLDRRRKAQAEIIQLQLKVMVNEADGLGFTGASGINAVPFRGASPFGRTGVSGLGGPTRGTTDGPTPAPTDLDFTPRRK